jgi:hypothetical protein
MSDVERYAKQMLSTVSKAKELVTEMNVGMGGSTEWCVGQVIESYLSMFDKYCPYKVGGRVKLKKALKIGRDSGWWGCRHFLIKGAEGTVVKRGYGGKGFLFDIAFDDESWIDSKGTRLPVERKHTFSIGEANLKKLKKIKEISTPKIL